MAAAWTLASSALAWLDAECPYPPLPAGTSSISAVFAQRRELLDALSLDPLTMLRIEADELMQNWRRRR